MNAINFILEKKPKNGEQKTNKTSKETNLTIPKHIKLFVLNVIVDKILFFAKTCKSRCGGLRVSK